jgi:uncharacterized membrane protein YidH (DUF202 family)
MRRQRDGAARVAAAARLLLKDLLRRRIALVLLFVVPALFDAVVVATTASREVEVTLAALVESGAQIRTPESAADPFDTALDDDGSRKLDERKLSLVFLGAAAVSFLACFLAFNLVHKRREVDARLVLAGYRAHQVLLAKAVVLVVLVAVLACYETAILWPWVVPRQLGWVIAGLFLGGLTYGCIGLLVGAVVKHELEGIFVIVLLTNVDVGWLQNPIYYAHSQRRALIRALPGHGAAQLTIAGALGDDSPRRVLEQACLWAVGTLIAALLAFGVRIAPARQNRSERDRARWHYAKVLSLTYAAWVIAFEVVGRYAATLHTVDLTSAWDRALPLVPEFVWPYEACYLLPLLSLVVIKDWHRFNMALVAILIANVAAFGVYLLVPVAFAQPALGASLSERVLALEYAADFHPGANKLPSMHVAMSWIMVCAMWRQAGRLVDWGLALIVVVLTVSPVLVKQHLLVDVAAGVPWGLAAYWVAGTWYRRMIPAGEDARDALPRLFLPWRRGTTR